MGITKCADINEVPNVFKDELKQLLKFEEYPIDFETYMKFKDNENKNNYKNEHFDQDDSLGKD